MKLVFASSSNRKLNETLNAERVPYVLTSQLFLSRADSIEYMPEYFLLDSGAYSVWKSGETVRIEDYIACAKAMVEKWPHTIVINLDVIPGKPGRRPSIAQIQQAMQESLANGDTLRKEGFNVMEVFHMGEPFSFLDVLLDRLPSSQTVMGISPRKDLGQQAQEKWLKQLLGHFLRRFGENDLPRCHGLGVTAKDLLAAFPFYSADSTSWANAQIWGQTLGDDGRLRHMDSKHGDGSSKAKPLVQIEVHTAVQGYRRMERDITRLWERRGVVWSD